VVFVTGTLDFIVAPLAEHLGVTDVIASQLQVEGGQATGELTGPPLGGEEKARQARLFAEQHGLDLAASFAYGDSRSDAPLLALVGHPVAVNPSRGLRRIAAERGWEVVRW
jgi:HAD superfamily hydrolase (TIGR01490 family)